MVLVNVLFPTSTGEDQVDLSITSRSTINWKENGQWYHITVMLKVESKFEGLKCYIYPPNGKSDLNKLNAWVCTGRQSNSIHKWVCTTESLAVCSAKKCQGLSLPPITSSPLPIATAAVVFFCGQQCQTDSKMESSSTDAAHFVGHRNRPVPLCAQLSLQVVHHLLKENTFLSPPFLRSVAPSFDH